jgi:hypothetical protein
MSGSTPAQLNPYIGITAPGIVDDHTQVRGERVAPTTGSIPAHCMRQGVLSPSASRDVAQPPQVVNRSW